MRPEDTAAAGGEADDDLFHGFSEGAALEGQIHDLRKDVGILTEALKVIARNSDPRIVLAMRQLLNQLSDAREPV